MKHPSGKGKVGASGTNMSTVAKVASGPVTKKR